MTDEKHDQPIDQAFRDSLNESLKQIDDQTQTTLFEIRRNALRLAQQDTATDVNRNGEANVLVLSSHSLWKNKKITSMTISLALAASVVLVVLISGMLKHNNNHDFSADFVFYSEVDPDWLLDMEIAEIFGDD